MPKRLSSADIAAYMVESNRLRAIADHSTADDFARRIGELFRSEGISVADAMQALAIANFALIKVHMESREADHATT